MSTQNKRIVLAQRPDSYPRETDFCIERGEVPHLKDHELLLKNLYISLTPGDRLFMNNAIELGSVMRAHTLSQIVDSNGCRLFSEGDMVVTRGGWQEFFVAGVDDLRPVIEYDPITINLSVLGPQGLTAYFGLLDVARPIAGNKVLISGASGTVGSIVGQIAKLHECEVIGICSDETKQHWLMDELGFDMIVEEENLVDSLFSALSHGINIYFDNVGGAFLDAVLRLISRKGADHALIVCCGMVSQYNRRRGEEAYGIRDLHTLINKRIRMEGFIVGDYKERYTEALDHLKVWLVDGKIKVKEDITFGLENAPLAFVRMMMRQTFGKALVKIQ